MITDWDDAYNNRNYCTGVDEMVEKWTRLAAEFRENLNSGGKAELKIAYGTGSRNVMDLFLPAKESVGLIFFVHGGYWRSFDNSYWSHLAAGPLHHSWSVCMPAYTLAPEASIAQIVEETRQALEKVAAKVTGPIRLIGHSAGGHLVSRMICRDVNLAKSVGDRIDHVVSLSGVHDLRPLLKTRMNVDFKMDEGDAASESPALCLPMENVRLTCVAGSNERPEFVRQNALLANIWTGLGVRTDCRLLPSHNHFTVVEELAIPDSDLVEILLS